MKIFSIVGWSGSGKTSLISRLIEDFKGRKRRVIAVKKAHRDVTLQPEAKDSAKFLRAGADEVYLLAPGELLRMTRINGDSDFLSGLLSGLRENDVVLLEGLTRPGIPVIEVADDSGRQPLKSQPAALAAVVSARPGPADARCFHPDQISAIAAFMEDYRDRTH
jgi:molybdopterin-guanine dinucleotide biosynthesis protein MobB